jgi:hypothetical protein
MKSQNGQLLALVLSLILFVYLTLALTEVGGSAGCHWAFPRWFGCVLWVHETLAAGLMAGGSALIAAWMAWTAVQKQINAQQERMTADRDEAERLLTEELSNDADGMAAAWRLLVAVPDPLPDPQIWEATREATAYMASRLSRPDHIANLQAMAEIVGWDRRRKYLALIKGLENLARFGDAASIKDPADALNVIRNLADDFEYCLPQTAEYFAGLWRRPHKALSFADYVRRLGGRRY